jgi:hypothetical protein
MSGIARSTDELNRQRQADADAVYALHGKRAPQPEPNERADRYDERLTTPLQKFSDTWKGIDYGSLREDARTPIRAGILADAAHAADHPVVPEGELKEIRRADSSGRVISTFHGSPSAWLGQFKLDKQVARIRDPRG